MVVILDALMRALSQMGSPEFRAILWKSIAYGLVLVVLIAVAVMYLVERPGQRLIKRWMHLPPRLPDPLAPPSVP